ncbi:hypothetical protein D3C85_1847290 [compost metagenome]
MLINECLQDEKNGVLRIKHFLKKPLNQTGKNKLANERLKKSGFNGQMPLITNKKIWNLKSITNNM